MSLIPGFPRVTIIYIPPKNSTHNRGQHTYVQLDHLFSLKHRRITIFFLIQKFSLFSNNFTRPGLPILIALDYLFGDLSLRILQDWIKNQLGIYLFFDWYFYTYSPYFVYYFSVFNYFFYGSCVCVYVLARLILC